MELWNAVKTTVFVISRFYCMYYSAETNRSTLLGTCSYTCFNPHYTTYFELDRYSVSNYSAFDDEMCNPLSRSNVKLLSYKKVGFVGYVSQTMVWQFIPTTCPLVFLVQK